MRADHLGHTPACMTQVIGDARTLYRSTQRLLQLPAAYRMFLCHDCGLNSNITTVAAQHAARS